jgi:hypothetical protein
MDWVGYDAPTERSKSKNHQKWWSLHLSNSTGTQA